MVTRTASGYAEHRREPIVDTRTGPGWRRSLAQVGRQREVGSPGGQQRWSHGRCRVMPSTAGSRPRTQSQGLTRNRTAWLIGIPRTAGTAHARESHAREGGTCTAGVHSAGSSGKSVSEVDTADRSRSLQLDWLATAYALAGHVGSRRRSSCGRGGGRVDVVVGDGVGNAVGGAAGGTAIAVASAWAHRWR